MNKIKKSLLALLVSGASLLSYDVYAQNTIVLHAGSNIVEDIKSSKQFIMQDLCDKYNDGKPASFQGTGGTPGFINRTMKKLLKQQTFVLDDVLEYAGDITPLTVTNISWAPGCEIRKAIIAFEPGGMGPGVMDNTCTLTDSIFIGTAPGVHSLIVQGYVTVEDNIFIGLNTGVESHISQYDTPCGIKYNLIAFNNWGMEVYQGLNMDGGKNIFYRNHLYNAVINQSKSLETESTIPKSTDTYVFTIDGQDWYDKNGNFLTDKAAIGQTLYPPLSSKSGETFTINNFGTIESTLSDLDHNGIPDLDPREGFWSFYEGGPVNAENPDNDGDGYSDAIEVTLLHSDPLNPMDPNPANPPKVPLSTASALAAGAAILYLGRRQLYQSSLDQKVGQNPFRKPE